MTKSTYQPPYTITADILNRVAAISEAIGRLTVLTDQSRTLRRRRINRIRTIHGSLAIEGNTLSEAKITAILAVEYKGADRWNGAEDDRLIGGLWANLSEGRCRFVMVKDKRWDWIEEQLK